MRDSEDPRALVEVDGDQVGQLPALALAALDLSLEDAAAHPLVLRRRGREAVDPVVDEQHRAVGAPGLRPQTSCLAFRAPSGVSWTKENPGRYHGRAPPSFSAKMTTRVPFRISSPSVGSGSSRFSAAACRRRPASSSERSIVAGGT